MWDRIIVVAVVLWLCYVVFALGGITNAVWEIRNRIREMEARRIMTEPKMVTQSANVHPETVEPMKVYRLTTTERESLMEMLEVAKLGFEIGMDSEGVKFKVDGYTWSRGYGTYRK